MILEFVAVHRSNVQDSEVSVDENERPEAVYFRSHLDGDQSGFLDVEEISQWVEPTGFIQVRNLRKQFFERFHSLITKNIENRNGSD